ncbi:MAG: holo-ACP synthase [Hydrogenoanaerobacterium sp.]
MTLNTGIDMIEIKRIEHSMQNKGFIKRVFSQEEQVLLDGRFGSASIQTAAANFAAKEAFAKAMGSGISGFALNEVSLLRDELGKPYYVFDGAALELVNKNGFTFSVSVTHTKEYAAAVAVAYTE